MNVTTSLLRINHPWQALFLYANMEYMIIRENSPPNFIN